MKIDFNDENFNDDMKFIFESLPIRLATERWLEKHFGRCPDYEENCECCRRWKLLDELLEPIIIPDPQ